MNSTQTLGIILAAGRSTRLLPATSAVSKQLLPVYDKPLIYYPLSTLMLAGIRDFVVIVNPHEKAVFEKIFEHAALHMGINVRITTQAAPNGLAEAFPIAQNIVNLKNYQNVALILGDNVFHGATLTESLHRGTKNPDIAKIFGQKVVDPLRFGIVGIHRETNEIEYLVEKPSMVDDCRYHNYAITGLYFFPNDVAEVAMGLVPSKRGELEIVDLIKKYYERGRLYVEPFKRGISWFDTGTSDSLLDAAHYVKTIQTNQGFLVGSPHEVAIRSGWVEDSDMLTYIKHVEKSSYGKLLREAFLNG